MKEAWLGEASKVFLYSVLLPLITLPKGGEGAWLGEGQEVLVGSNPIFI
jgi:hypothetical protein